MTAADVAPLSLRGQVALALTNVAQGLEWIDTNADGVVGDDVRRQMRTNAKAFRSLADGIVEMERA